MSNFGVRRGPNVSQYIANLNTIPSAHELAQQQQQDGMAFDDDLALFTNNEFFDFDVNEMPNMGQPVEYDPANEARSRQQHATAFKGDVFAGNSSNSSTGNDFAFPDFSTFHNIPEATYAPNSAGAPPYPMNPLSSPSAGSPASVVPGDKRKLDHLADPNSQGAVLDEGARLAAEEDKRRRNTAASARFRVKKKQREQALEKTAKEMTDKVDRLEAKVQQLEMENKWLKELITEKNDGKSDIADMFKTFTEKKDSRSREERKDGVGTEKA